MAREPRDGWRTWVGSDSDSDSDSDATIMPAYLSSDQDSWSPPDARSFIGTNGIKWAVLASFLLSLPYLIVAEGMARAIALWYAILGVGIDLWSAFWVRLLSAPFDAWTYSIEISWEAAAASLSDYGLFAWIVGLVTLAVWFTILAIVLSRLLGNRGGTNDAE